MVGETTSKESIDYALDPALGWLRYLRVTNASTGKLLLALDVEESGTGFQGEVHRLVLTTLKERFLILPPCDERQRCESGYAPVPTHEAVNVVAGFTWVDEIAFLFTFPIGVGGGAVSFQFVRPDGHVDQDRHVGAGDRFEYTFRRYEARGRTEGTWLFGGEVAATGGLFMGLYGVKDEVVRL